MWVTGFEGKETTREDISLCFIDYPQFRTDFDILYREGIIKRIAFDQYGWTESKTSCAEYFHMLLREMGDISIKGGRWATVEKVFKIDRETLSRLASGNGNAAKPEKSRGFMKIEKLVKQHREKLKQQAEQEQKDRETFAAIKTVIDKTGDKDINEIKEALERIKKNIN